MVSLIFGWTYEEWSLMLGSEKNSRDNLETLNDFLSIRRRYLIRNGVQTPPSEKLAIYNPEGDTRTRDYEAAHKLMELVMEKM